MLVSSVTTDSSNGKTNFSITLTPNRQSSNNGLGMEMSFNKHSPEEIAELRVRSILLGELLPKDLGNYFPTKFPDTNNRSITLDRGIFPELWTRLQTQPTLFLPKAWLWAAYCLKTNHIVESIQELELGPVKNKVMPVRFRGQRKQFYMNQEPSIIQVVGSCTLSA